MNSTSLAGRTVVLTRPLQQSIQLERELIALGAHVVQMPLIAIARPHDKGEALQASLAHLQQYDWVVVTSANGAAQVAGALSQTNIRPKLAAVGKVSADALGVEVDFVPTIARGDELVAQFPRGSGRVLLAQAQDAGGAVAVGLRARGYVVDAVAAYATEAVVPSSDDMELAQRADAVVFYSGSAVRSWCAAFGATSPKAVVAIGKPTEAVAHASALRNVVVASEPTTDAVVAALRGLFQQPTP
jgi:uroporphyrinogen III methyltransferase/synthase